MDYHRQLKHPKWQKRRLEIMQNADFKCQECGLGHFTLNVHHRKYIKGRAPWEYNSNNLVCLCEDCHGKHHDYDNSIQILTCGMSLDDKEAVLLYVIGMKKEVPSHG